MAAGKRGGARRPRGQDPRDARPQGARTAEIVAPRRVLDAKAARLAAGDLLSRRAWTQAQLAARLRRRGAPPDVAAEVVTDLVARGYVDDAAFARQWTATRSARGYGETRLRAELRARGVDARTIAGAVASASEGDTLGQARAVARRRLPALRRGRPDRVAPRLRDHLLRRGFSGGIVARVVREVTGAPIDRD